MGSVAKEVIKMERVQVVGVKQVVDALVVIQTQHIVIAEQCW